MALCSLPDYDTSYFEGGWRERGGGVGPFAARAPVQLRRALTASGPPLRGQLGAGIQPEIEPAALERVGLC